MSVEFTYTKEGSKYILAYNKVKKRQCCVSCCRKLVGIWKILVTLTKTMSFLTKYEDVLLKCNKIWSKVKSVIKRNNSIVTQCLMTIIWTLKLNHSMTKSPQMFMVK